MSFHAIYDKSPVMTDKPHISVAPMMDWTDRHCRHFHRLISPHSRLYTEMVTTGALLYGDQDRFLRFDDTQNPLALQLGGSDPTALAECAAMATDYGYDEINLNCGCPSDRVQSGRFGACLMREPNLVATCIQAMQDSTPLPVTVKCRIAIDDEEEEPFLRRFLEIVSSAGCTTFIIHARKAWLKGLSPKENRDVPPLNYTLVKAMKQAYPELTLILNGGLQTIDNIKKNISYLDGTMIGREAYQNPWFLAEIEKTFFDTSIQTRKAVALAMIPYIEKQHDIYGTPIKSVTRHMTGLFQGIKGAKAWRRHLSEEAHKENATADVIKDALDHIPDTREEEACDAIMLTK